MPFEPCSGLHPSTYALGLHPSTYARGLHLSTYAQGLRLSTFTLQQNSLHKISSREQMTIHNRIFIEHIQGTFTPYSGVWSKPLKDLDLLSADHSH
jgi:hypothetical protein